MVASTVRITVTRLSSASCQQYHSMIAAVPRIVSTPENREGRDCDTVVEMFSTSLVMRLMTSPWEWVSRYCTGRSTILPKSSSRMRRTMFWLRRALIRFCRSWPRQ